MRRFSAFMTILLLGACTVPAPVVRSSGTLPGAGTYGFGLDGGATAAASPVLAERLAARGLTASDSPLYLVQTEFSRPPAKTGTVDVDRTDSQWRRAPVRGGGEMSRLSLSITEIASGTEVYRATAWQRQRGKADDSAALMRAVLSPPAPQ